MPSGYPWYDAVQGDDLEQGDILEACPVFLPPDDLTDPTLGPTVFRWEERDLIVMSQTCDLVKGREKLDEVLFCAVWQRSEMTSGYLATNKGLEDCRRGNLPGFHLLANCTLPDHQKQLRIVDFRRVHTLPLGFVRRRAATAGQRIRLQPPYREHLSQAFARFFMRVGLPADIPPFR